jgi:hypothetical protein
MAFTSINSEKAPNVLTGYTSAPGTVASSDSVLQAIQKLNGNYVAGLNTTKPAFLAQPTSAQENITINAGTTIVFGTEIFDQASNFASSTFTAPITGKYCFNYQLRFASLDTAAGYYDITIVTSNRNFSSTYIFDKFSGDVDIWCFNGGILCDMDIGDTAHLKYAQNNGTQQTDIGTDSHFSGFLVC